VITPLPNKRWSGHRKITGKEDHQRTPGKDIHNRTVHYYENKVIFMRRMLGSFEYFMHTQRDRQEILAAERNVTNNLGPSIIYGLIKQVELS